jgi:hypothetical protein
MGLEEPLKKKSCHSDGLDDRGSIPGRDKKVSSSPQCPDRLWALPSLLTNGYRSCLPGIMRPGSEADYPTPPSAYVKDGKAIPPLPHTSSWRGAYLVTHKKCYPFKSFLQRMTQLPTSDMPN